MTNLPVVAVGGGAALLVAVAGPILLIFPLFAPLVIVCIPIIVIIVFIAVALIATGVITKKTPRGKAGADINNQTRFVAGTEAWLDEKDENGKQQRVYHGKKGYLAHALRKGTSFKPELDPNGMVIGLEGVATLYEMIFGTTKNDCYDALGRCVKDHVYKDALLKDGSPNKKPSVVETPAKWEFTTTGELKAQARSFGTYLRDTANFEQKEKLAIWAGNCTEWMVADMSCYAYGWTSVSVYDTLGPDAASYIIADSSAQVLVVEDKCFKKVPAALKDDIYVTNKSACLKVVVHIGNGDAATKTELQQMGLTVIGWQDAVSKGKGKVAKDTPPKPADVATLMYTSGTTGAPKGVMISHRNLIATMSASQLGSTGLYFEQTDVHLSYLPLAHIFERQIVLNNLYVGAKIYFGSQGAKSLLADASVVRPTIFPGVPKVFENIRDGVCAKLHGKAKVLLLKGMAAKIKDLETGCGYSPLWDMFVFKKTKQALGGKVRFCITGGAPISGETLRFVQCCIGPIVQGYGATETIGSSLTQPWDLSVGHVGPPLPSAVIRLVDVPDMNYYSGPRSQYTDQKAKDAFEAGKAKNGGEVWIGGPGVSSGYYDPSVSGKPGNPSNGMAKKTKEDFFTDDGWNWFKTGDIGSWTESGCLKIVDRRKNMFKVTLGEYIPVEEVEKTYQDLVPWADFVFLPKETKVPYVALIVVVSDSIGLVMRWAKENGVEGDAEAVVKDLKFKQGIMKMLDSAAEEKKLQPFMRVKSKNVHVEFQPPGYQEQWVAGVTCKNGSREQLLTATFKARRSSLDQYYAPIFPTIYPDRPADHILP